jgi:hypothetical protein
MLIVFIILFSFIYYTNTHIYIKNKVHSTIIFYNIMKITMNKKNILDMLYGLYKIIIEVAKVGISQKIHYNVKKIDNITYELTHVLGGKLYKFRVKSLKGPTNILQVIDNDTDEDITDILTPYLNSKSLKILPITPKDLNYSTIIANTVFGEDLIYTNKDKIIG